MMVGAKLVFPGPHLDPASLLDLLRARARHAHRRRADDLDGHAADLDENPGKFDLLARSARCSSAARRRRESLIEAFESGTA